MPNDKEIRIRAVLDASSFDKGVNEIQQKLKNMTQQSTSMQGAQEKLKGDTVLGKYAQQAFGDFSKESQKQLEQMFQSQRREAVSQKITMREKQQELDKLAKSDEKLTKQQEERVKLLKEELGLIKEKHRQTIQNASETQKTLDQLKEDVEEGGEGGGAGQQASGQRFKKLLQAIGIGALAKGVMDAVVTGMGHVITRERKIVQDQGASLTIASKELREQMEGRGSRGMFFARERAQAMNMASEEQRKLGLLDYLKIAGGTAVGAVTGAAAGSLVPGLGTAAGAIAGGTTAFSAQMIASERLRSRMFDQERYRALMTREGMEKYEANLAALKARTPKAVMAQQYLEQNREQMATMQQQLGFGADVGLLGEAKRAIPKELKGPTPEGMFGPAWERQKARSREMREEAINFNENIRRRGFLETQMRTGEEFGGVGFNQRNIMQQVQALIGGGATTAGARNLAGMSAAYGRQMNIGNAAQVLGQISGGGVGAGTEDAYKKLLTEAVKMGVDTSKMPQEMQRMTAMTAQIATQGGGFAAGAVETAMAGIGGFDRTAVQAAKSAADMFRQTGKQAGGWEGQMGLGFLQSAAATKLAGKKLNAVDMNYLNQFSFTEATEDDFSRLADYLGTSKENAKELLRQKDVYKQTRTSTQQKAIEDLGTFLKEKGTDEAGKPLTGEALTNLLSKGEGAKKFTAAEAEAARTRGAKFMGMTRAQRRARILQLARLNVPTVSPEEEEIEGEGGELGQTAEADVDLAMRRREGRVARVEEGAEATGDLARIQAFNENIDRLKNAAAAHTELAEEYNVQFQLFKDAMKSGAGAMEEISGRLEAVVDDLVEKGYISTKQTEGEGE